MISQVVFTCAESEWSRGVGIDLIYGRLGGDNQGVSFWPLVAKHLADLETFTLPQTPFWHH